MPFRTGACMHSASLDITRPLSSLASFLHYLRIFDTAYIFVSQQVLVGVPSDILKSVPRVRAHSEAVS